MKKAIFALAVVTAVSLASCSSETSETSSTDSTSVQVDTTHACCADSVAHDSLSVDSVAP